MGVSSFLDQKFSLKIIFTVGGAWFLVFAIMIFYFFGGIKEGFQAGWKGVGAALNYNSIGDGVKTSWENKSTFDETTQFETILENQPNIDIDNRSDNIFSDLETNVAPTPLQDDETLIFKENKFSPECCPSDYSNSSGCVCATPEQVDFLNERGGNRTFPSQF